MPEIPDVPLPPVRIFREWKWQPVYQPNPRIGGGAPPLELVAIDQLEVLFEGQWIPVPVVEAEKPEKPVDPRIAQRRLAMREGLRQALGTAPSNQPVSSEG